jgi:hypothetical protein
MRYLFWALTSLVLSPLRAEAYGIGEPGDRSFEVILYSIPALVEVAIPDVRLEVSEARGQNPVLSWPVHLRLFETGGIRQTEHTTLAAPRLESTLFLEPQLALGDALQYRGILGARLMGGLPIGSALAGLLLEGGGLLGTDGHGGFVGGGLCFALLFDRNFPYVAVVARRTWTAAEARVDFALDFVLPFPIR